MPLLPKIIAADRSRVAALAPLGAAFVRFLAVGTAGLAVDAGLFALFAHNGMAEAGARALSLAAATLLTWQLNRHLTFAASGRHSGNELTRYATVALSAQAVNYATFLALRLALPELPAMAALLCGAALAAIFSFTGQRLFTFAPATARSA